MLLVWFQSQLDISPKFLAPVMVLTANMYFVILAALFVCVVQFTGSFVSPGSKSGHCRRVAVHRLFVAVLLGLLNYLFSFIGFAICSLAILGFFTDDPPYSGP